MIRATWIAAIVIAAVRAQSPDVAIRGEITGTVVEPGVNAPIAAVEVTLDYLGPKQPRIMPAPAQSTSTARTNASGVFTFQIEQSGMYTIRASKQGLRETGVTPSAPARQNFMLTREAPTREIHLYLTRSGGVTGVVVDDETGQPIADLKVAGGAAVYLFGRRILVRGPATTGADGRFTINGIPGDYYVEIAPQTRGKDRVLLKFSEEDIANVDMDYERTYWPGGHGEDSALPVSVTSGALVDLGRLRVKKVPYFRVHLRVPKDICRPDELLRLHEYTRGAQFDDQTTELAGGIPCGTDLLITRFAPGNSRLLLTSTKSPRATASVPIAITSRNLEVTAGLSRGIAMDARFVLEDGAAQIDFTRARLLLDPLGMLRFADTFGPKFADEKGQLRVEGLPEVEHRVNVTGVGPTHYAKEIRFNGNLLRDGIAPLDIPAVAHSLTIVLDDKAATISGAVMNGDKAVPNAMVLLAKWPAPANQAFVPARIIADGNGRYQFTGLAPGEYRVLAVPNGIDEQQRPAGSLERAMAASSKIELSAREMRTIDLTPVTLR
ncbi:MAG: hypothetical protein JWP63_4850 [Candidatus Solibacter sp.]|nr:hypothetical protein [Candidatus Solibacter sp.]